MQTIKFTTTAQILPADLYTPVGIYLRLRDQFRDAVLLESTDFNSEENSYSFIGIQAIAGIEIDDKHTVEYRLPKEEVKRITGLSSVSVMDQAQKFMDCFEPANKVHFPLEVAQGLLGYITYNSVSLFETIPLKEATKIPLVRFRFYQYIIAINHFKDELYLIENHLHNFKSDREQIISLIAKKDVPEFPFETIGAEKTLMTDAAYIDMVQKGIAHCLKGNVFQVVLSRKFYQPFIGDDFNVYRSLRHINPGPYLFYFDYGNYRLFGSSPESQIILRNNSATIHPIAGTVKRTGDTDADETMAKQLMADPKENAEHTMLVDLARNDLSRFCSEVKINYSKKLKYYSHLIHLVSEIEGVLIPAVTPLEALGKSFPAGTLSGAPKFKAMQIIEELENESRGFYGGAIGMLGFNGNCNMAIMIRTFLSKDNQLEFQAGAGIVAASKPENELQEVNHKVAALRNAIQKATSKEIIPTPKI